MKKNSFTYDELISCGNGELFGPGNAKLPLPPMLMFDRITEINDDNGTFKKGVLKAELDRMGMVKDSGTRKKNERNRTEIVWTITTKGYQVIKGLDI